MRHAELEAAFARALWLDYGLTLEQIESTWQYKANRQMLLYGEVTASVVAGEVVVDESRDLPTGRPE